MNISFSIKPLPRIYFGAGSVNSLPGAVLLHGKRILLLTGAASFTSSGNWAKLRDLLAQDGIDYCHAEVSVEPSPLLVNQLVTRYGIHGVDVVVAIGGGSVLDCGKAVSAMLPLCMEAGTGIDVTEYLEGVGAREPDGRKVPFIAVPTTSGTGSEVTSNAVLSEVGASGFKKSLRHDNYIPDAAIVDPSLTKDCPRKVSVNCSLDAFTQLVESYLSIRATPFSDDIALGALQRMRKSLLPVCLGEGDVEDRINMAYGAMISGVTLTNVGLGIVHGFASVIGGRFPVPHGVVCGTLMASANQITLRELRKKGGGEQALQKYTILGQLFSPVEGKSSEYYQDSFIQYLHAIISELEVAPLGRFGITANDLLDLAEKSGSKNNPVALNSAEKQELLAMRIN